MRRLVFILNPRAGTDRIKALQGAIDTMIDNEIYHAEIQYTVREKHGTLLAREAALSGAAAVIAIGGDGSVNDVAAGLAGTGVPLGIIPKGSGNGMARTLGIPLDIKKALQVVNAFRTADIDMGIANDRLFISNAGVGYDAVVAQAFAQSKRRGLAAYAWLTARYLWQYRPLTYRLTIDGTEQQVKAFMINVANGQQFGYNFSIAPQASWTDGLLDVIVIKPFPKIMAAGIVLRAATGTILHSRYISHFRAKEITIEATGMTSFQADGDEHGCNGIVCCTVQAGIQAVIVP